MLEQAVILRMTRRDLIIITTAVLLVLIPFLNKAYHIDDTLFLQAAEHILKDPVNFYGFMTNWYGVTQEMSAINQNPPLVSYYIALVSLIGGWAEPVLHGAFLIPAIFFGAGAYLLARFFCTEPLFAALMAVFTPVFGISASNVMSDVLMCAFYIWAVYLWVMGLEKKKTVMLLLSVCALSLGFLTKYFAASAIPLLLVYTVGKEKKLSPKLLWFILPIFVILMYQWWTKSLYGHGLLANAVLYPNAYKQAVFSQVIDKTLVGLSFAGSCVALSLFAAPLIWRGKASFWAITILLLACMATLLLMRGSIGNVFLRSQDTINWGKLLQLSLWIIVGIHIFAVGVIDMYRHRDMPAIFLFLWTIGTFIFSVFINWTVNGRTLLPMIPAVAIQHARLLPKRNNAADSQLPEFIGISGWMLAAAIPAAMLTLVTTWADAALANAQRQAANVIMKELSDKKGKVWFQGHWGFQYYMEENGATALDFRAPNIQPGDFLVFPVNNTNTQRPTFAYRLAKKYAFSPMSFLTTMRASPVGAGFYADIWGPLPFSFAPVPDEEYLLFSFGPPPNPSGK